MLWAYTTVSPVVYAHSTTYSVDVDKDGLGGANVPKYAYAENDSRLLAMASEQLEGKGLIIVSGAAFMSNFEVQATISDNGSEKNYSNYKICENLLGRINPVKITDIATVQAQTEAGHKYTIEGVVTSNASGYDKATAFFDCIYVQDETGGINCFPVATGLASYDNTFVLADGTPMAPRIRVRDRNDVVCTAHEHTFGEWIVTTQPTCTEPGEKTRTCTGCGEVETMVIDATGHHYKDGKCTDCGAADPGYQPTQPGVKTGDESNTTMWIIVLVCAAALAVVLVIVSRKKRNS